MSKLEKSNKIFNFKVVSKFFYFEPINKKYLNKKYLNWLNNPNINRFLSSVTKRNTTKDLYEKINSLRKNNGELFSIHKKKDSIHIGNLTISIDENFGSINIRLNLLSLMNFKYFFVVFLVLNFFNLIAILKFFFEKTSIKSLK